MDDFSVESYLRKQPTEVLKTIILSDPKTVLPEIIILAARIYIERQDAQERM